MAENTYTEDKRFILETLKHTSEYVGKLDEKFETFKLETAKSIIVIQTKLAMYVAGGSLVAGVVVQYTGHLIGK